MSSERVPMHPDDELPMDQWTGPRVTSPDSPPAERPCEKCGGEGTVPGMVTYKDGSHTHGAGWGRIKCEACNGKNSRFAPPPPVGDDTLSAADLRDAARMYRQFVRGNGSFGDMQHKRRAEAFDRAADQIDQAKADGVPFDAVTGQRGVRIGDFHDDVFEGRCLRNQDEAALEATPSGTPLWRFPGATEKPTDE